jgi:hypothetical protein
MMRQADWITSSSDDVIDSAASSTNTPMPPGQHGGGFRHLQGVTS